MSARTLRISPNQPRLRKSPQQCCAHNRILSTEGSEDGGLTWRSSTRPGSTGWSGLNDRQTAARAGRRAAGVKGRWRSFVDRPEPFHRLMEESSLPDEVGIDFIARLICQTKPRTEPPRPAGLVAFVEAALNATDVSAITTHSVYGISRHDFHGPSFERCRVA